MSKATANNTGKISHGDLFSVATHKMTPWHFLEEKGSCNRYAAAARYRTPCLQFHMPLPAKVWLELHCGVARQIGQLTLQRLFIADNGDLVWGKCGERVLGFSERAIKHRNFTVIKAHESCANDVHGQGIIPRDDETHMLRFSRHRTVPLHAANTVNHREVTFGRRPQGAVGIRIEKDAGQVERHSPACIVAIPVAAAYDFFGIAKNSVAETF